LADSLFARAADIGGPAQPLLMVRGLSKHFGKPGGLFRQAEAVVRAVDGIDFDLAKGETLGIVGESGCGKSTTSRLIMALVEPTSGEVIFDGEHVGPGGLGLKEYRRNVQMVFQDSYASLNPRLTIAESIGFAPRVHGLAKDATRTRVRDLLDAVGLAPDLFAQRYPHELSGGQRQRVNIARALALRPRLIILDEPVSALDKSVEAQVLNLLVDVKAQFDLSYLFISHDLNVVQFVSDRVLVMYLGQIVEIGPVDALYDTPAHPYTAALLASRPSMDPDQRRTVPPLIGDPPNPVNPPPGCRFHPRCALAEPICSDAPPKLAPVTPTHKSACLIAQPASGHSRAA
jgi:peptide/nickel transport system ATP-binding protein